MCKKVWEWLRLSFAEGRSLGGLAPFTSAFCDLCRRDSLHQQLDIVTAAKVCTFTTEPLLHERLIITTGDRKYAFGRPAPTS